MSAVCKLWSWLQMQKGRGSNVCVIWPLAADLVTCYSKLHKSLCCKLWNSSPWFPASLNPTWGGRGNVLRPEGRFLSKPEMCAEGILCGSSWNPWGCLNKLFWLSATWISLLEPHSVHCHLSKKQGRAMDSSWRSWAGLSVVWILYSLLAALRALQLAGVCIRKIMILSSYLPQLYFKFFLSL